ncbi:MAG: hypothetical protein KGN78_07635 [Actinomycetales bacterium]|nr:hypothetical protein [Actinomycetales bacterium]
MIVHTGVSEAAPSLIVEPEQVMVVGEAASVVNSRLHALTLTSPLVLVLFDEAVGFAPALALGQRSAGRRIAGYCLVYPGLIDPVALPSSTADWPDAPVCIAAVEDEGSASARLARLHGWEFITAQTPAALADAISHWGMNRRLNL